MLGERVGGEFCEKMFRRSFKKSDDEATTNVFYMSLLHGDIVKCVVCRLYLDECVECVAGDEIGVVKCRQVSSKPRDGLHRVAPPL